MSNEPTIRAFSAVGDITQPEIWHRILTEARRHVHNLLDIDVPVISVIPGPAHAHGEYAFAGDIVLAADSATFKDEQHLNIGVMPANGVQVFYAKLWAISVSALLSCCSGPRKRCASAW